MVLGRVITGSPRSESRRALRAVPPPPRQMRASSPSEWKLSTITSRMSIAVPPTSIRWGFSRLVPRMVPPLVRIPDSASSSRRRYRCCISPRNPSLNPMTFMSWLRIAALPMARMAAFSPGESPPAVRMPMLLPMAPSGSVGGC